MTSGASPSAVVVQCMVSAQKAGVMFTSNPITNDYDTVVLEAAWGLGEAIVSGIVTPDNLWINKHTGRSPRSTSLKRRPWWSASTERGGTKEIPVPEDQREAPVLTDDERNQLVTLANRIEAFYKSPRISSGHRRRAGVSAPVPAYHHHEVIPY